MWIVPSVFSEKFSQHGESSEVRGAFQLLRPVEPLGDSNQQLLVQDLTYERHSSVMLLAKSAV